MFHETYMVIKGPTQLVLDVITIKIGTVEDLLEPLWVVGHLVLLGVCLGEEFIVGFKNYIISEAIDCVINYVKLFAWIKETMWFYYTINLKYFVHIVRSSSKNQKWDKINRAWTSWY